MADANARVTITFDWGNWLRTAHAAVDHILREVERMSTSKQDLAKRLEQYIHAGTNPGELARRKPALLSMIREAITELRKPPVWHGVDNAAAHVKQREHDTLTIELEKAVTRERGLENTINGQHTRIAELMLERNSSSAELSMARAANDRTRSLRDAAEKDRDELRAEREALLYAASKSVTKGLLRCRLQ